MGRKRIKHLNELRAAAATGDQVSAAAYMAAIYVPPHLRPSDKLGAIHGRTGYSGEKSRPYVPREGKQGVHLTAKTHRAIRCTISKMIAPDYGMDRLQMLKERRA